MFNKTSIFVLALFFLMCSGLAAEGWETDWKKAVARAKAENKDLLVDFTGSDWCGWCIKLNEEVFSQEDFTKFAKDKFVLVELDFPQKKEISAELKKQNQDLGQKYQVQGYPTILLLDAQELPYAKTGYQAGGPTAYNAHLTSLMKKRLTRDAALAEANKVEGVEKAKKLIEVLASLAGVENHYEQILKDIATLDPNDTTGFQKKKGLEMALAKLQQEAQGLAQSGKGEDVLKKVDAFLTANTLEGESKQKALFLKIFAYQPSKETMPIVEKLMDEVIAIDTTSETAQKCQGIKQQIEQMKKDQK